MKKFLAIAILLATQSIFSQAHFEKGYFISRDGNKTACLIKNEDWMSVPSEFKYRLSEGSEVKRISQSQVNTLEIPTKFLFERHTVDIDRYSTKASDLSEVRVSNFKKESLLLKVIVDGKARLLRYSTGDVNHFFYMLDDGIYPLEYKMFAMKNGTIGKNFNYQKTLREELACQKQPLDSKIRYKESDLVTYFTNYNACHDSNSELYSNEVRKGKFNIRGKISIGTSDADNPYRQERRFDFEKKVSYKFGFEVEYVFPFNNNKWSLFIEPTYQSYSAKTEGLNLANPNLFYSIDYSSIQIPVGLRHYMYLNDNNKVFLNAGVIFDMALSDEIVFENRVDALKIEASSSFFIGIGYEFKGKYSIEIRHNASSRLSQFALYSANFTSTTIKLGYNFL
ncbi:outer membrane beta-barrel protein [Flavobacteriaceae bacterium S356]|uniref:Outer membrane beta-barrel protein n=1 Tax=Asprobacillus argus TaxID=3076534 RepID=A0ABU3LHP9_9FLAO|nr:outer membrane beta-barrel protein [Flavobacteriaceae bacterium S356]